MTRRTTSADEANPTTMPDAGLLCAIAACENSTHDTDRQFAQACRAELQHRMRVPKWAHPPERRAA
jgi:hypothetical protein